MSLQPPRAWRVATRLVAAAAAGSVAAGAFAAPASAEIPGIVGDPVVDAFVPHEIVAGDETQYGPVTVEYESASGHEDDPHEVTLDIVFEGSSDVLQFDLHDECEATAGLHIACSYPTVTGGYWSFSIDYSADAAAENEVFTYTMTVTVDGQEVERAEGGLEVFAAGTTLPHNPFIHGDVTLPETAPGSSVEVSPVVRQEKAFHESAAAVVVAFSDPFSRVGMNLDGAEAVAGYDNCAEGRYGFDRGVTCVIADFTESAGSLFTLSDPASYAVGADTVGPLDICHCYYNVYTVNAVTLATDFGHLSWDPASANLLSLVPAETWDGPTNESDQPYMGAINFATSENPYDLQVEDLAFEGKVGDKDTVTTTITNNGPASAPLRVDYYGSYAVRVELPQGAVLSKIDSAASDDWACLDEMYLDSEYERSVGDTVLSRFDLVCYIDSLAAGKSIDFTFTVKLTDIAAASGLIEIDAAYDSPYADTLDADADNNVANVENLASEILYDYDKDGHSDLLAVRKSDGALRFYAGTGAGAYKSATTVGYGWGKMDVVMAGDLTGDGVSDFLARDGKTGTLYTYPGDGEGGHGTRIKVGTGWNGMGQITVGNFDGDGVLDLFATRFVDDKLYYYPGNDDGTFGSREPVDEEWEDMDVITTLGDVDGDGFDEIVARWNDYGYYYLFDGSTGEFTEIDPSLGDALATRRYTQTAGVGDVDGDGYPDLASVDSRTGQLLVHSYDENHAPIHDGKVLGNGGWGAMRLPVLTLDQVYDLDGSGTSDFVALRRSDSDVFFYPGTSSGHGSRVLIGEDWTGVNLLSTGGDLNGDGFGDLLVRNTAGRLYTATGNGGGFVTEFIEVGSGWNSMSMISGGHDYNSDGKADLLAVKSSTGVLYLYPGRGDGTFGSRKQIGTGWNSMREVTAVGDLDHDGHADMVAVKKSDGCLYFYGGRGNGLFKSRVKIGCGWNGYDQISGVGDFNRDGHVDWLARRKSDGNLFVYYGDGAGDHGTRIQIGTAWNSMKFIA